MLAVVVYVLTGLAAVAIVLTRLRLGRRDGRHLRVGSTLLNVHTVAGGLALLLWLIFLVPGPSESVALSVVGILALGLWWITALAGLLILSRWAPSKGRHAVAREQDGWSEGPALSVLAHVGMAGGVILFTWAYLVSAV